MRARRKALGKTLQQVAYECGLTVGVISQIERGISVPSLIPIQTEMLNLDALSDAELNWLNDYHSAVFTGLRPFLGADDQTAFWLEAACRKLARP